MEQEQSIRQKLNKLFSRYHYVGIKNITKEPFKWTVALEQHEILNMGEADSLNEESMAKKKSGTFLPGDGVTKQNQKIVNFELQPGEKKMIPGEAAYVLIEKLYNAAMREKYGSGKEGLSKMRVPTYHDEMIPKIVCGPIVKNVGEVLNTMLTDTLDKIEDGFSDVQTHPPEVRRGRPPKVLDPQGA